MAVNQLTSSADKMTFLSPLIIAMMVVSVISQCPSDTLTPCTCSSSSSITSLTDIVICNRVALTQVKAVFTTNVKTYYIPSLILTPSPSDSIIISNVTANHAIGSLTINCPNRITPLQVDPSAFTNTKLATSSLTVQNCNLSSLNWAFLTGFSNLSSLSISRASDLHQTFYTLPTLTLTKLTSFRLSSVMGLNNFYNTSRQFKWPAPVPNGLESVQIFFCYDLGDNGLERIFTRFITPSAQDTLTHLGLAGNNITALPIDIQKLNQLQSGDFFENLRPMSIQTNAFKFQQPVYYMYMDDHQITSIASGAFSGNFSNAQVSLFQNLLTSVNYGVFYSMLQQMSASTGYLELQGNPIDCTNNQCDLSWLVKSNPNFLNSMWSAQCSNGTYLWQLNPATLKYPNGIPCP